MTWIQWIFHYFEIKNMNGEEKKLFFNKLNDIERDIQAFYLVMDIDKGQKMIDTLQKIREEEYQNKNKNKASNANNANKSDEELPDLLSDEEKELWAFMEAQPKSIRETDHMKNVGKFILPKKNKDEIINSKVKTVDKKDIKKPKLGF